ncbi:MAG: phosphoribosyl-AMP cyclohydrolase, partial [Chloroflexota bacterium]|nr:phosphoribosyl-AMP cyclohydrolase [Chloroflexota bacterium]
MNVIKLDDQGLVPAVVQHVDTGDVLMLAYMNSDSIRKTLETGDVWFYSRSRHKLWHTGESSGNYLRYRSGTVECDGDTI